MMELEIPHSQNCEMMVLGSALARAEDLKIVSLNLKREDFYFKEHQMLFAIIADLKEVDMGLLFETLKKQDLISQVGGFSYILQMVQGAGTSICIEDYVEEIKKLSKLRKIAEHSRKIETRALQGKEEPEDLLEDLRDFVGNQEVCLKHLPIYSTAERIRKEEAFLQAHQGKKYLGLQTSLIGEFNECFLGLRGLNLLAAAPNTGKTALALQLAVDAVMTNPDVCLVFVSLEMSSEEIFRRIFLLLAEMDYRTWVLGPWKEVHQESIQTAKKQLLDFHERIQILEPSLFLSAQIIENYTVSLKAKTGCPKAIVVIDYLQVWPMQPSIRCLNENEMDKWRIGEMKKLKDCLQPDPVIVISEARKPNMKENTWGGDLSDVMGSARTTYTPDVVMLLTPFKGKSLQVFWEENAMPSISSQDGEGIKTFLEAKGIALCRLEVPKARDGMQKFTLLLEFHFRKNKFKKLDLEEIRKEGFSSIQSKGLKKKNSRSFADLFLEA